VDYGEFLFRYDFNPQTLLRAHKLALKQINSQAGGQVTPDGLSKAHNDVIRAYLTARQDSTEWTMDRIMGLMISNLGLNGNVSVPEVAEIYKLNDHDARPLASTPESLPRLAEMGELGIISNLPHDSLIHELRGYDFLKYFRTVTVSYQVGFRKPHPAIYQEAMRRAQTTPEKSTFLSHDQEEVNGAQAVGMRAFLAHDLAEALTKLQTS